MATLIVGSGEEGDHLFSISGDATTPTQSVMQLSRKNDADLEFAGRLTE